MKKIAFITAILFVSIYIFSQELTIDKNTQKNIIKVVVHHKENSESFFVKFGEKLEFFNSI